MGESQRETDLLAVGVGAAEQGSETALMNRMIVPADEVNLDTFLGVLAACAAMSALDALPALRNVIVVAKAYGETDASRVDGIVLEAYYEGGDGVSAEAVSGALQQCPILRLLSNKISSITASRREK